MMITMIRTAKGGGGGGGGGGEMKGAYVSLGKPLLPSRNPLALHSDFRNMKNQHSVASTANVS